MEYFIQMIETVKNGFNEVLSQLNYVYSFVFIITVIAIRMNIMINKNKSLFTFLVGAIVAIVYALITKANYAELIISIPFSMVLVGILDYKGYLKKLYKINNNQ